MFQLGRINLKGEVKPSSQGCNRHKPLAAFSFKPATERRPQFRGKELLTVRYWLLTASL
jgi:hypothetical protein